jgi:hypothetical protein
MRSLTFLALIAVAFALGSSTTWWLVGILSGKRASDRRNYATPTAAPSKVSKPIDETSLNNLELVGGVL